MFEGFPKSGCSCSQYIFLNHRDHRKITVIDGNVGFIGGLNFADEYINRKKRFGVWKDTGLMLRGSGVYNLTALFLESWDFTTGESSRLEQFTPTLRFSADGMVQPYGDSPLDEEAVAENVYFNILQQATDYVYIATPYLVVDNEMITTLSLIAKSAYEATKEYYVTGIISKIKEVDTGNYGNATYYISVDGKDANNLTVFRGYNIGGEKFTAEDQIKVGQKVVVAGTLTLYGTEPEMNAGNKIISIK